jgi:hypothetical protein
VQSRHPFANSNPSPFSTQSPPSRVHSLVYLRLAGFGNLRDYRSVRRIHIRELALPGHEPSINVILD